MITNKAKEKVKDLNYWKNNCEEDYLHTPISVLRYITELEKEVENKINFIDSSLQLKEKNEINFEDWKTEYVEEEDSFDNYFHRDFGWLSENELSQKYREDALNL